jgi:hypothetical protein
MAIANTITLVPKKNLMPQRPDLAGSLTLDAGGGTLVELKAFEPVTVDGDTWKKLAGIPAVKARIDSGELRVA